MRSIVVVGALCMVLVLYVRVESETPAVSEPGAPAHALTAGQPAPAFTAQDTDGRTVTLYEYQGRPVVINFWATWCAPCRQEMWALQTVYEAHQAAGLVVLAVSQDQQDRVEAIKAYWTTLGLTFHPLLDPEGRIASPYNVFLLPSTVFVHPSGTITAIHLGPMTPAQIEQHLQAIMLPPG